MKIDLIEFVYYKDLKDVFPGFYTNEEIQKRFLTEFGILHRFNYFRNNTVTDESKFTMFMMKYPHLIQKIIND